MKTLRHRTVLLAAGLLVAVVPPLEAPAALDMALGTRKVVQNQPVSACNQAARSALTSVFGGAQELGSAIQVNGRRTTPEIPQTG